MDALSRSEPEDAAAQPQRPEASSPYQSILGLLLGATFLFVGQGVFLLITPLRLAAAHDSPAIVSAVGSAYFFGIVCGAWFNDRIVRAVGNARSYGSFIAVIVLAAGSLMLVDGAAAWAGLRFLHGWAAAGAILTIESWLNGATPDAWRGRVLGSYIALSLLGLGLGQLLVGAVGPAAPGAAEVGLALFAASVIPVLLTRSGAPQLASFAPRSPVAVYRGSPLSAAGCIVAGLCMGAFWALGPAYAASVATGPRGASLFMACVIFGGLAFVWPLGRLSDGVGRRTMIALAAALGCAVALVGAFFGQAGGRVLLVIGLLYGGVIFSLYPLSVSHAADRHVPGEDMLAMTRGLLLASNLGQALGPLFAGQAMAGLGSRGFFLFGAATTAVLATATVWRMTRRPPAPPHRRRAFAALPDTTPAALSMDPRLEPPRCLVPDCSGIGSFVPPALREALWDRFYTAAPRPLTPSERRYSDRKLRSRSSPSSTA